MRSHERQRLLPFLDLTLRRERLFRAMIVGLTVLAIAVILGGTSAGRSATRQLSATADLLLDRTFGVPPDRGAVEARIQADRLQAVERARERYRGLFDDQPESVKRLMSLAGMDPDRAVLRWANFDQVFAFSSLVVEPDDTGRSYRFKPGVSSIWVVGITLNGVQALFLVPATEEVIKAAQEVGGLAVPGMDQLTNSWGFRGPEPNLEAPLRVVVLGDSMMQGVLVSDDDTAPARLQYHLEQKLGPLVSVLNTGVLGYSPEQYFHTLEAIVDRFKPHAVVISYCANDFGDMKREQNWAETAHWVEQIGQYCRSRGLSFLHVPLPTEIELLGTRDASLYPGRLSALVHSGGMHYLDPIEAFTNTHLELLSKAEQQGKPLSHSPLFNSARGDHHFSASGDDLWGQVVAERLVLVLERQVSRLPWVRAMRWERHSR